MNSDFDFFTGEWNVLHRRLVSRLSSSDEWEEFDGRTKVWPLMGGLGNIDDNIINIPSGPYHALTMRSFDPKARQWAIWWLDGRNPHTLDVPVIGTFTDGEGTFFADDTFAGKPIKVRFRWLETRSGNPRWEQAFSPDGGSTWETNWTMQFTPA